jgi:hypothetical protein
MAVVNATITPPLSASGWQHWDLLMSSELPYQRHWKQAVKRLVLVVAEFVHASRGAPIQYSLFFQQYCRHRLDPGDTRLCSSFLYFCLYSAGIRIEKLLSNVLSGCVYDVCFELGCKWFRHVCPSCSDICFCVFRVCLISHGAMKCRYFLLKIEKHVHFVPYKRF